MKTAMLSTRRDHRQRLNRALQYIHEHPEEDWTLEDLARRAWFSAFHFHRIFAAHVGESPFAYIRRLRLERAVPQLTTTDLPVTAVALAAGYSTLAAFGKAFKQQFGIAPSDCRNGAGELALNGPVWLDPEEFYPSEEPMIQPEIRVLEERRLACVRRTGPYGEAASSAWSALMKWAWPQRLVQGATLIGISHDDPAQVQGESLRYDAALTVPPEVQPDAESEVELAILPGGRYAVFLHAGPYENFGQTYQEIFAGWLPASGEELRDAPCYEVYLNRDPRRTKPENLRTEIHVPLREKGD